MSISAVRAGCVLAGADGLQCGRLPLNNRHIIEQGRSRWCAGPSAALQVRFAMKKSRSTERLFARGETVSASIVVLRLCLLACQRHVLMFDRIVLMLLNAPFMSYDLPVEPIDHEIDRCVQIAVGAFDEDILAL